MKSEGLNEIIRRKGRVRGKLIFFNKIRLNTESIFI